MQGGVNGYWADEVDMSRQSQKGDDALMVSFHTGKYFRTKLDESGIAVGAPEEFEAPFVRIEIPGDTKNIINRVAVVHERDPMADNNRFPRAWAAYQAGAASAQSGLSLSDWPLILKGHLEACRQRSIYTVEQLAALPDGNCDFLGAKDLREKAKKYLAARDEAAKATDLESVRREMEELKAQNAKLMALAEGKAAKAKREAAPAAQ